MNKRNPENTGTEIPQLISYLALRKAVGILGITFPVVLAAGSVIGLGCKEIQSSISSYYHTGMRDIFMGYICAIAFFMFAYKGYDRMDSIAGKLACLFALGVAFFPTSVTEHLTYCIPSPVDTHFFNSIHFVSAGLFFLVLAYFSLCQFTQGEGKPTDRKRKRNILYRISGFTILGSLVLIAVYFWLLEKRCPALQLVDPVFWLETLALWAFGIAWLTKGRVILADLEITQKKIN